MLTAGKLAKLCGISRTALLYYDSLGLLSPSARSDSGYRLYDDEDAEKLKTILLYREMGLSLDRIKDVVGKMEQKDAGADLTRVLFRRLGELNDEMQSLKLQQKMIIRMIEDKNILDKALQTDEVDIKEMLSEAGVNPEQALQWHKKFEKHFPVKHGMFLKNLGFSEESVQKMREWVRKL